MLSLCLLAVITSQVLASPHVSMDRPLMYLRGTANVDKDSPTSFVEATLQCDRVSNQCSCSGQNCRVVSIATGLSNVTVVTMKYNAFDRVPANSFSGMNQLETLEIMQGSLVHILPNAFLACPNLKVLNLAVNMITQLHPLSLNGLLKLERLILTRNEIKNLRLLLPSIAPSSLPSLQHLHVGGNPLTTLPEDLFVAFTNSKIKTLELIICDFQYIHPNALLPLKQLEDLYLGGNDKIVMANLIDIFQGLVNSSLNLLDISSMSFADLPVSLLRVISKSNVKVLMLARTPMPTIAGHKFPYMPNLDSLVLVGNRVQNVEPDAFRGLPNLKRLYLQKNIMTSFPEGLRLRGLEELDISGFHKFSIRFELNEFGFSEMTALKVLKMSFKTILKLQTNTFDGLSNLEVLNIRSCGITSLEEGVFAPLRSLQTLDLSHNQILQSQPDLFHGLTSLKTLLLHHGQSNDVNSSTWRGLDSLETLDVSYNAFTQVLPLLVHLKSLRRLNLTNNNVGFWEKPIITGVLENLDLSNNLIRSVTPVMIHDLKKLNMINMTRNPFLCDCTQLPFLEWLVHSNVSHRGYSCQEPSSYSSLSLRVVKHNLTQSCVTNYLHKASLTVLLLTACLILCLVFVGIVTFYLLRHRILVKIMTNSCVRSDKHFKFDAFVSYSNHDSEWVFNVFLPQVENATSNAKLCVYDRDFLAGKAITDCIVDSIKKSRKTILIVSEHFLTSSWCKFETNLAQSVLMDENRDGLVVVKLGDVDFTKADSSLKFLLQSRLYLTWSEDPFRAKDFWRKLDKALEKPEVAGRKLVLSSLM